MAQLTAGETLTLTLDGKSIEVKIEDASKSDTFEAKILSSAHPSYNKDQICTFERSLLTA